MTLLRIVSYNTYFGGRDDDGLGDGIRWNAAARFLRYAHSGCGRRGSVKRAV